MDECMPNMPSTKIPIKNECIPSMPSTQIPIKNECIPSTPIPIKNECITSTPIPIKNECIPSTPIPIKNECIPCMPSKPIPSTNDLLFSIAEILRDADLTVMTMKKVRLKLEEKFKIELLDRRVEMYGLVMKMLMDKEKFKDSSDSEDSGIRISQAKASKLGTKLTDKIMALSKAVLSSSIAEILKDADLDTITAKKVRLDLEKKFRTDLLSRKQEIQDIVMEMLTANANKTDESDEHASEDSEAEAPPPKKAKPNARASQKKGKKAKDESSEEEDEPEDNEDDDDDDDDDGSEKAGDEALARKIQKEELQSRTRAAKKSSKPAKAAKPTAKAPRKAAGGGGGKKNNSGFTREYNLSDELAAVVGAKSMARHAVVKKIWEVVKEKNLYDPTDKRFAICNDELMSVFRIKRFRTFSMMKYLSKHFLEPS